MTSKSLLGQSHLILRHHSSEQVPRNSTTARSEFAKIHSMRRCTYHQGP